MGLRQQVRMVWDKQQGPATNPAAPTKMELKSQQSAVAKAPSSGSERWFIVHLLIFEFLWAAALTLSASSIFLHSASRLFSKEVPSAYTHTAQHIAHQWFRDPPESVNLPKIPNLKCWNQIDVQNSKELPWNLCRWGSPGSGIHLQPWREQLLYHGYLCYPQQSCTEWFPFISPYPGVNRGAPQPTSCSNASGQRLHCMTLIYLAIFNYFRILTYANCCFAHLKTYPESFEQTTTSFTFLGLFWSVSIQKSKATENTDQGGGTRSSFCWGHCSSTHAGVVLLHQERVKFHRQASEPGTRWAAFTSLLCYRLQLCLKNSLVNTGTQDCSNPTAKSKTNPSGLSNHHWREESQWKMG